MMYDCAIIGGGPAGLNAALVLGRARRSVALIDNDRPRNAVTHASHGFLTRDGVTPTEFRRIAYEEVLRYPSVAHLPTEVISVSKSESGFELTLTAGVTVNARKVILATGVKEIFPQIEGFYPVYGKSLFNCPYCDGWEMQNLPLVLVSEQQSVYHMAKLLLNWTDDLVVCTNGKMILTNEQKTRLLANGIVLMEQPISAFIGQNGQLTHVIFEDGTQLQRAGGFIMPRFAPATPFAEQLGCERAESGSCITDASGRTSVPGVFAAGDAAYFMPSQLILAAASGSRTATGVNLDLTEEDFS
ncbi:NAD(P)/FAD-dependent oxidoreductase [Brevibacillus fluminis]|uniref:NAD(P)/FAD-dependent oxidoreductase n=1 Tax=Brevibacillus fluminis TaxID=511487 RepID=A0A3M8DTV9_9BACL|nr:NAD(P)/FAD-dependent oxidoreductase [Brevibacillus fluminis]RNB91620.1 NAD(P)/FAD-dependent oxidoreductase [Brevibacillus fluminis]